MTTARIICALCFLALLIGLSPCVAGAGTGAEREYGAVVGLFADADHSDCDVIGPVFYPFEMWVWWLPTVNGLMAAEFAIQYPSNVIASIVTLNPEITVPLGNLPTGTSVAFRVCQIGWTWTHHQSCYLWNTNDPAPTCIQIVSHPTAGALQIADCTVGYPIWPAMALTPLYLNQIYACPPPPQMPRLSGVTVTGTRAIRAQFDMCVIGWYYPPQYFVLRNKADARDSINFYEGTWIGDDTCDLLLQEAMTDSTTYVLRARDKYWSCSFGYPNHSEFEFTFFEATATEESSWGAIKALFGK